MYLEIDCKLLSLVRIKLPAYNVKRQAVLTTKLIGFRLPYLMVGGHINGLISFSMLGIETWTP